MIKNEIVDWENPFPKDKNFLMELFETLKQEEFDIAFVAFNFQGNNIVSLSFFLQSENIAETAFTLGGTLAAFTLKYGITSTFDFSISELDLKEEIENIQEEPLLLEMGKELIDDTKVYDGPVREQTIEERVAKLEELLKS